MTENTARMPIQTSYPAEFPAPDQVAAFRRDFTANPLCAVESLERSMGAKVVHPEAAAAILLPYLVKTSYAQQNLVAGALERIATPEQILNAALALHERIGDPRLLSTADQLLANRGPASWSSLKSLCETNLPTCRYFVSTVATLEGVSEEERRDSLLSLARNPDLDTRWEILALLDGGILSDPLLVWKVLVNDSNETIAAQAADRVASLVG